MPALQACVAVGIFLMFILPDGMKMKKHISQLIGERKNSNKSFRMQSHETMDARTLR